MRKQGKQVLVLTNGATFLFDNSVKKFKNLGFDFRHEDIFSSRMGACNWIKQQKISRWSVMGKSDSNPHEFGVETRILGDDPEEYEWTEGFLLLSTLDWNRHKQLLLDAAYEQRPRPSVAANPDLIAPLEIGFSTEPGFVAHRIVERFGISVEFHGKPFPSVFELVMGCPSIEQKRSRIAMVGDTLHTDVLGGAANGWSTVLVTDHGLFRGTDVTQPIKQSGIIPTYILPQI